MTAGVGVRRGIGTSGITAVRWLIRVEHFLPERSQGRDFRAEAAIPAISARAAAAVSTRRSVTAPDAGDVMFVVGAAGVFGISGQYSASSASASTPGRRSRRRAGLRECAACKQRHPT